MKEFKPAIVLFLVTLVSGFLLGCINTITLPKAEEQKVLALNSSLEKIFPAAEDFHEIEVIGEDVSKCFEALSGSKTVGYVIQTNPKGYGGTIEVLTGIDMDGSITRVRLSHTETPGLGANADKETFIDQYNGKFSFLTVVKQSPGENDIQAITSATITSNAVTLGVNTALAYYSSNLGNGVQ